MSRSYKKAIVKNAGSYGRFYRNIKRRIRQYIKSNLNRLEDPYFDFVIPKEKEIVNDYRIQDGRFDLQYGKYPQYYYYELRGMTEEEALKEFFQLQKRCSRK